MLHSFTQNMLHCFHFTHNTVSKLAVCSRHYWCERGGGVNIVFVYFGKPFMKVRVHMYGVYLVSVIFRSAFTYDTQASHQPSLCGGPSEFLQGKVNSSRNIPWVVKPVLLSFIKQEGDVFFNRTTHIHIRLLRSNVLYVVYNNCPGQQVHQISRQLNAYGT